MSGGEVTLRPMTAEEFDAWRVHSVASFAADLARATGRPIQAAQVRASAQFEELLPDGRDTAGHWLFVIADEGGRSVGTLWLGPHPERQGVGYVFDIEIAPDARRHGYGRAAMLAAEGVLRAAGMTAIALNVFGFNTSAQQLYLSIGYQATAVQMSKTLSPET